MFLQTVRFLSVLFTALAPAPALAYLVELPNKIGLPRDEYVIAQKLYRGWQFVGVAVVGALLFTLLLASWSGMMLKSSFPPSSLW